MIRIRTILAGVIIAAATLTGGGTAIAASAPAQTVTSSPSTPTHVQQALVQPKHAWISGGSTRYCNWPYRVAFSWWGKATIHAYSPGGAYLGSRVGSTTGYWYTPWEDVRFNYHGDLNSFSSRCYW